jgi:hypothetical protein
MLIGFLSLIFSAAGKNTSEGFDEEGKPGGFRYGFPSAGNDGTALCGSPFFYQYYQSGLNSDINKQWLPYQGRRLSQRSTRWMHSTPSFRAMFT